MALDPQSPASLQVEYYLKNELDELLAEKDLLFNLIYGNLVSACWYLDLEQPDSVWIADEFWRLLGVDGNDPTPGPDAWHEFIYPEDKIALVEAVKHHCIEETPSFDIELKFKKRNHKTLWLHSRGVAIRDENGRATRCLILHTDISANKLREHDAAAKSSVITALHVDLEQALSEGKGNRDIKSGFLARVSHEMRTPMNAIMGFAQIQKRYFDADTPEQLVTNQIKIMDASKHLLLMIENLLEMTPSAENTPMLSEVVELNTSIDHCFDLVREDADVLDLKLLRDVNGLQVLADEKRLVQVLMNLIANAVKFNKQGGHVLVSARSISNNQIEVLVEDTGAGIDEKENIDLFLPFARTAYADQKEVPGVGIGLALSKHLVQQMQGDLGFRSEPGMGTQFWLKLPSAKPPEASTRKSEAAAKKPLGSKPLVLYIEDHGPSRELLEVMFESYAIDAELLLASNAEEGMVIARQYIPKLILIDINLPGMSGIEALAMMRSDPAFSNTRFAAISAEDSPSIVFSARAAGFNEYFSKPVDFDKLQIELDLLNNKAI